MAGLILARAMNIKFPAHDEIISWQTLSRKEVQRPLDWNASVKLSRIAMKFNLTVAFIAALSFVTDTLAEKTLPPGAGPDASVPANILLSIDNSSSMNTNVSGPRVPTDPKDIAIDSKGNWYVVHGGFNPVRQYASSKKWTKDYGAPHKKGMWDSPRVAFDASNNLYLTDYSDSLIHKFNSQGNFIKSMSTPWPRGIDLDADGNIYVTGDTAKYKGPWTARKLDSEGTVLYKWTVGPNCSGCYPYGISVFEDKVYIVSSQRHSNVHPGKYSRCKKGYPVRVYVHNKTTDQFDEEKKWYAMGAHDIEATENGVYTVGEFDAGTKEESCGGHVGKYSHDGGFEKRFGPPFTKCPDPNQLYRPIGLGSDSTGNIYVVGGKWGHMSYVKQYDSNGEILSAILPGNSRMNIIKCVLHRLLQNEELNKGINYGLLIWSREAKMAVRVSPSGAEEIIPMLCDSSYCSPAYDSIVPRSGTYLDEGMRLAEDYFGNRAEGFTPGPIDPTIPCQNNFVMVLSDGNWSDPYKPEAITRRLLENMDVQTLVVGFGVNPEVPETLDNYKNLSKEGGTYPYSPLFVQDEVKLQDTLEFFVQRAQDSNLTYTGTVPTIASKRDAHSGDHIYQSTFTVPESGQWQGKLTKYRLNADTGSIGDVVWEAGSKLNEKPAESRKIWTVATNVGVASGINNFVVANLDGLKSALYEGRGTSPTDDEARQLIQFIRGVDAYDANIDGNVTEQRHWKLADIYHSEMAIVGPPEKVDSKKAVDTNTEAYYKETNGFQAFVNANTIRTSVVYVGANDGMLHAFDDTTGEELWAFIPPNMLPNLREMKTSVENTTIPIYGVDGSPVVKDIYYNGQWRTILMAGLGRDGYGYFALDVTTPETPKFLFAFSNDPENKVVRHWGPGGSLTKQTYSASGEFNYSKLGEAWSTPTIIAMPYGSARKWVAAIGGGFNSNQNQNTASAVYLIDLENNGKVLKLTDLTDSPGGFINSAPAQLTAVTPDSTAVAQYKGAFLYFTDIEGKLSKINLTNAGQLHGITELFDGKGNLVNQRAATFPVTASSDANGKVWLYFGTGNQDKLQLSLSTIQNRVFGIKDKKFPIFSPAPKSTSGSLKNVTHKGSVCPTEQDLGWYTNLDRDEKSVGKLVIHNGVLFAPNYTPDIAQQCYPGTSRLFELDYGCGKPLRSTSLGSGQLTGVRIYKDKMYLGISGTSPRQKDESVKGADGFTKKGNIVVGTPVKGSTGGGPGSVTLHSWREIF